MGIESRKQGMEQSEGREEGDGTGCCMCGDVGFSDQLLRCPACRTRSQHTYCSRMYPSIEMDKWQCEWCLHNDYKHQQQKQQQQLRATITTTRLKKRHRDKGETVEGRDFMVGQNTAVTAKKQRSQQIKESSPSMAPPRTCDRERDQWRKPRCNSSTPRRYKLLADVLC